jgi:glucose-1-phosphate thymidylyltransferase
MAQAGQPLGVILAAGRGTRLQPLTPRTPKPLVPLLNRPLAAYAVDALVELGLHEIVVVVSPGDEGTIGQVRAAAPPGVTVDVATQPEPRGPGDAVLSVGAALDGRVAIVLAADAVLAGSARAALDAFLASDAVSGLLLKPVANPGAFAFGVAILDGERVVDLEEKPVRPRSDLALVGLWMLRPAVVERLRGRPHINAKGESDLTATVADMVSEGAHVAGWVFDGEWLDGGTLAGLLHAQLRMLRRPPFIAADGGCLVVDPTAQVSDVEFAGPALVGARASISHSRLEDVVVGEGARLANVRLTRVLVAPGAILDGDAFEDAVVTAAGEIAFAT